jgi:hypothetical protein
MGLITLRNGKVTHIISTRTLQANASMKDVTAAKKRRYVVDMSAKKRREDLKLLRAQEALEMRKLKQKLIGW